MANYLQAETTIDATPEQVWSVVGDLRRQAEWSPQCRRMFVLGKPLGRGSRTININRQGAKIWPTTAVVVDYDAPKRVAFRISENRSVWSYELDALPGGGTRLTERRETPDGTTALSRFLIRRLLGGNEPFERDLLAGMNTTLSGIKKTVEDSVPHS